MYILNNIVYADYNKNELKIKEFKIIAELYMLVTFSNGEKRVFDLKPLMEYPIYKPLEDYETFKTARIENGVIVLENGEIDIAPEKIYKESYKYEEVI